MVGTLGIPEAQSRVTRLVRSGIIVLASVLCVARFTPEYATAGGIPSPEILALSLAEAYDRNDRRAIQLLITQFNVKLTELFNAGELEQAVGLVQIVAPAATKWTTHSGSSVDEDVSETLRQLSDWQTLEALARNQFEPRRIVLGRSLAKDEMPLPVSVESGYRRSYGEITIKAQIYRSLNGSTEWIGETPQHVILYPGHNVLVLSFFESGTQVVPALIIDITLNNGRVRVHNLHYGDLPEPPEHRGAILYLSANSMFEFISSIRQRYPTSSVLQQKENGLPSLDLPLLPEGHLAASGGPVDWGSAVYRKIQIESDPTGASILINGRLRGTTPQAILVHIPKIRMILRKEGFLETVSEIDLTDPVTVLHANLNPIP